MSECKAPLCNETFHWCSSCGMPETAEELAKEDGYCSAWCAIEELVADKDRIAELEAENQRLLNNVAWYKRQSEMWHKYYEKLQKIREMLDE